MSLRLHVFLVFLVWCLTCACAAMAPDNGDGAQGVRAQTPNQATVQDNANDAVDAPALAEDAKPNAPDANASAPIRRVQCAPDIQVESRLDDVNAVQWRKLYPDVKGMVQKVIEDDCNVMFVKNADVPTKRDVLLVVVEWQIDGAAAYVSGNELHLNADYLIAAAKSGDDKETLGVLHHEVCHFYQVNTFGAPGWLIEGMADYVRYRTGYVPLANRKKGGAYTDSYQVTGFFFDDVERQHPGTMAALARDLSHRQGGWTAAWFVEHTGQTLDKLWASYQQGL